ncbi:MAG: ribonuclease J, partial [Clostridia bacterium]|nr:ribonuclease J [Clostridia bacterium]
MPKRQKQLEVSFLGGVGEIGKNMTAIQYADDIIRVDCGSTFPSFAATPGIDLRLPDFSFIKDNREKVKGIL